jgi:hypothetical protein
MHRGKKQETESESPVKDEHNFASYLET